MALREGTFRHFGDSTEFDVMKVRCCRCLSRSHRNKRYFVMKDSGDDLHHAYMPLNQPERRISGDDPNTGTSLRALQVLICVVSPVLMAGVLGAEAN